MTMQRLALLVVVTLLAACSGENDPAPTGPVETTSTNASAKPPASAGGGANLTGRVSPLTSAVSGLNMRRTDYGTVIDLPADALFAFDKAELTPGATDQLLKSAQVIRGAPAGVIKVVGHTDAKGDDAYNQKLSEARARTVADWFAQQVGVRQRQFEVSGMGETEPVAPNETLTGKDDPAGRAMNRRVEVIIPNPSR